MLEEWSTLGGGGSEQRLAQVAHTRDLCRSGSDRKRLSVASFARFVCAKFGPTRDAAAGRKFRQRQASSWRQRSRAFRLFLRGSKRRIWFLADHQGSFAAVSATGEVHGQTLHLW
jgi:hypothetical protein